MLRALGALLSIGAIAYVARRLFATPIAVTPESAGIVAFGMLLALAANMALAWAWMRVVRAQEDAPPPAERLLVIYGVTQIGKYLPGNIVHFAGRYGLGRKAGVSHRTLALATLLEPLGLITAAGLMAAVFVYARLGGWIDSHRGLAAGGVAVILCGGVVLGTLVLRSARLRTALVPPQQVLRILLVREAPLVLLLYLLFLALNGVILCLLLPATIHGAPGVISANAFAWLLGYITVGAPAGIGVREAALLFALPPAAPGRVVAAVALYRVATMLGDVLFFGLSLIRQRQLERVKGIEPS